MKKGKYDEIINQEGKLVLVDFFADWCGPCQTMMPTLEKLGKEHSQKMSVIKVNIDKNAALATNLGIRSVPSLLLYRAGKVVWRQVGAQTYHQLNEQLKVFINR